VGWTALGRLGSGRASVLCWRGPAARPRSCRAPVMTVRTSPWQEPSKRARWLDSVRADKVKARFIEPMLLLKTESLPDDTARWAYQLKIDGYRSMAFRPNGPVHVRSRNATTTRFRSALSGHPEGAGPAPRRDRGRWRARCRVMAFLVALHYSSRELPHLFLTFLAIFS
jgi:hypothetical protein